MAELKARDLMVRGLFPIPTDPTPEGVKCITLMIPDDMEHEAVFAGALALLTKWNSWQKDGTTNARDCANTWRAALDAGWEACQVALTDVRQNEESPCILEKQVDGGAWEEFADLQLCPPRLRRNEGRIQWFDGEGWVDLPEQGDEKEDGTYDPPFPDPPPGEEGNCLAAENLTALLQSQVNEWETALTAGAIALGIVTIITGVLSAFFIPYATPAILGFATTLVGLGASGISSAFTSEVYETFKCIIYCNSEPDGSITTSQYDDIIAEIQDESGTAWDLIEIWVAFFGVVGLNRAGNSAGITSGDCPCNDCAVISLTYAAGTGPATVTVGEEFTINPADSGAFGGFSQFQVSFSQCVNVQWISSDVALRPGGGVDFFWRAGTGSPSCPGASDTYYVTTTNPATVNSHQGETHPANFMSSTAQINRPNVVLKLVSVYEP